MMRAMRMAIGAVLLGGAVAFSGCVVTGTVVEERRPRPVYIEQAPPPRVVYVEPPPPTRVVVVREAPPPAQQIVVVQHEPPAPVVETVPVRPGPRYVWTGGYWACERNGWVWVSGRWVLPPRAGAVYVPPRWERHGAEFHFSVGAWR